MNANRKQKADEHKTLDEKISKLEQPPEDTREITLKVNNMENGGGRIHFLIEAFSLEFLIVFL